MSNPVTHEVFNQSTPPQGVSLVHRRSCRRRRRASAEGAEPSLRADAQDRAPGREDRLMPSHPARGTIVFCHANGFPAGTYGALFEAWRAVGWRVLAPEKFGHDPAFAVTSGWPRLRDELLAFIEREAPGETVALVGHSMGGYLSLLAASRKPAVASAVVLLDAPIVAGWRAHAFRALKVTLASA